MTSQLELQLGKKGLTQELLKEIKKRFEKNKLKNLKISVLRSARTNGKEDVKQYAEEIQNFLGEKYTFRIIGFSIFLKKWRKERV
jgi:RNA-binding protein YhbY